VSHLPSKTLKTYDFIGHDKEVEFLSNSGNRFQFGPRENFSNWVMRSIYNNDLCSWRNCPPISISIISTEHNYTIYRTSSISIVQSLLVGLLTDGLGG
jgi:hypothetical protein